MNHMPLAATAKLGSGQTLVSIGYQVLLFILVFLPSGSILGFNVKIPAVTLFVILFGIQEIIGDDEFPQSHLFFVLTVAMALISLSILAIIEGHTATIQIFYQFTEVGSTIFIAWLSIFLVRRGALTPERLITIVALAIIAVSAFKIVAISASFLSPFDAFRTIQTVFGESSYVTGDIANGIARLDFTSDIMGPFALFVMLCPSVSGVRFKKIVTALFVAILLISGFIAFSRYLWFMYLFVMLAAAFIERNSKLVIVCFIAAMMLGAVFYTALSSVLVTRFLSAGNDVSDQIRLEQAHALFRSIEGSPLLGQGMGAHAQGVIRAEGRTYSYELQWVALFMQFGIVGLLGFAALIGISAWDLFACHHPAKFWLGILFALWIASGFTNPYLTNSFAGATFGFFMAIFHRVREHSAFHPALPGTGFAESAEVVGS